MYEVPNHLGKVESVPPLGLDGRGLGHIQGISADAQRKDMDPPISVTRNVGETHEDKGREEKEKDRQSLVELRQAVVLLALKQVFGSTTDLQRAVAFQRFMEAKGVRLNSLRIKQARDLAREFKEGLGLQEQKEG